MKLRARIEPGLTFIVNPRLSRRARLGVIVLRAGALIARWGGVRHVTVWGDGRG